MRARSCPRIRADGAIGGVNTVDLAGALEVCPAHAQPIHPNGPRFPPLLSYITPTMVHAREHSRPHVRQRPTQEEHIALLRCRKHDEFHWRRVRPELHVDRGVQLRWCVGEPPFAPCLVLALHKTKLARTIQHCRQLERLVHPLYTCRRSQNTSSIMKF